MRNGWEVKELGAVSAINYGYTDSASSEPGGPRFLRITDIQDDHVDWDQVPYCRIGSTELSKYRLASGDIVFARTGATTGKSFLVDEPPEAVFASYLIRLRLLDKKLLPEFVSLFFQTEGYWKSIKDGSTGSAQGGFNATKLGALSIPIPPLSEQQRIVGILDEAFGGIDTAKTNAEKNLQNAHALFESYLQSVFPHGGNGWPLKTLGELCDQITDGTHNSPPYVESGVPMLDSKHVKGGFMIDDSEPEKFISPETDDILAQRCKPRTGDILISSRGSIGKIAIVREGQDFNIMGNMILIRLPLGVSREFAAFYLLSQVGHIESIAHGVAQKGLYLNQVRDYELPLPSETKQAQIGKCLAAFSHETQRLNFIYQRKLAALGALKKSLLHQAFTGNL